MNLILAFWEIFEPFICVYYLFKFIINYNILFHLNNLTMLMDYLIKLNISYLEMAIFILLLIYSLLVLIILAGVISSNKILQYHLFGFN